MSLSARQSKKRCESSLIYHGLIRGRSFITDGGNSKVKENVKKTLDLQRFLLRSPGIQLMQISPSDDMWISVLEYGSQRLKKKTQRIHFLKWRSRCRLRSRCWSSFKLYLRWGTVFREPWTHLRSRKLFHVCTVCIKGRMFSHCLMKCNQHFFIYLVCIQVIHQ